MKPDKCQSKEDGVCRLPIGTCTQCEQDIVEDDLWDELAAEITTFTGATKIESFRLCEKLKKQGWKLRIQK